MGGTTTLAATYQDIGLIIPATNPLVADASGRLPLFFVADGSYALRLTDQNGIQSNGGFFYPQIPSIGASSSGGGGTPVDPTTVFSTGDAKWRLEQSTITGWVRVNGRTIGNASSGASERANADTQALFIYIYNTFTDAICPVPGGRGANALADFNANKQITLLDARGRAIFGLDDMGNAALGAFTGVTFAKGNATTGGSSGGNNEATLVTSNLPSIALSVSGTVAVNSTTQVQSNVPGDSHINPATGGGSSVVVNNPVFVTSTGAATLTGTAGGSSTSFPTTPTFVLATLFWKL